MLPSPLLHAIRSAGLGAIQPAQGLAVLLTVLHGGSQSPVLTASPLYWGTLLRVQPSPVFDGFGHNPDDLPYDHQPGSTPASEQLRPAPSQGDVLARVLSIAAAVLGAAVDADQAFMEVCALVVSLPSSAAAASLLSTCPLCTPTLQAGLDSVGAVELRSALGAAFGLELSATAAFDYPSPAALAAFIARSLRTAAGSHGGQVSWVPDPRAGPSAPASGNKSLCTDLVGIGCRYPGLGAAADSSSGLAGFWAAAARGANLQHVVPHQRWDVDWCYSVGAAPGRSYARFAAFAEVCVWAAAAAWWGALACCRVSHPPVHWLLLFLLLISSGCGPL